MFFSVCLSLVLLVSFLNFISSECPPGFIESGCTLKCSFPYYGQGCVMICECLEDLCDFMSGCIVTSKPGRFPQAVIPMLIINPISKIKECIKVNNPLIQTICSPMCCILLHCSDWKYNFQEKPKTGLNNWTQNKTHYQTWSLRRGDRY